jgi:hypothetical protein
MVRKTAITALGGAPGAEAREPDLPAAGLVIP